MAIRLVLAFVLLLAVCRLLFAQSTDSSYVIRNVRVFDGETITERRTVVISEGRITAVGDRTVAVPATAQEVPGEGRTLLPGLMDAHIHLPVFGAADALQQMLAFGVTTGVVMGGGAMSRLKEIEATDQADLAAILTAGAVATVPGGHPTQMDGGAVARATPTLTAPGEADAFVAARLSEGSDFIKIIYDDTSEAYGRTLPTLDEATVAAVVASAHKRGRIAVAHIGNERFARGAIAAGVDGLAHLFVGPTVSADFGRFAASHNVFVIPTMSVLYSVCGRPDGVDFMKDADTMRYVKPQFQTLLAMPAASAKLSCDAVPQAIRQLVAAKVPVLAGTDTPAPGLTYGASLHRELEHLVDAGLTPTAALAAATSVIARTFRLIGRGRIRPGFRADLLLVDGDPSTQIRATRNIVAIWKRGVRVQRQRWQTGQ
jgi:imidazolonepropionase-like amidohydrolase